MNFGERTAALMFKEFKEPNEFTSQSRNWNLFNDCIFSPLVDTLLPRSKSSVILNKKTKILFT